MQARDFTAICVFVVASSYQLASTAHAAEAGFCNSYADTAVQQNQRGKTLGIANLNPPVWSDNRQGHYKWCLGVSQSLAAQNSRYRERILGMPKPAITAGPMQITPPSPPQGPGSKQEMITARPMPLPQYPSDQPRPLSGDEIRAQLSGNTMVVHRLETGAITLVYLRQDGLVAVRAPQGQEDTGAWTIEGDLYCLQLQHFREGRKACARLVQSANQMLAYPPHGDQVVAEIDIVPGNPEKLGMAAGAPSVRASGMEMYPGYSPPEPMPPEPPGWPEPPAEAASVPDSDMGMYPDYVTPEPTTPGSYGWPETPGETPSEAVTQEAAQLPSAPIWELAAILGRDTKIEALLKDPKAAVVLQNLAAMAGVQVDQLAHMSSSGIPILNIPVKSLEVNWDKGVVFSPTHNFGSLFLETFFDGATDTPADYQKKDVLSFLFGDGDAGPRQLRARVRLPKDMPPGTYVFTVQIQVEESADASQGYIAYLPADAKLWPAESGLWFKKWGTPSQTYPMQKIACKESGGVCGFVALIPATNTKPAGSTYEFTAYSPNEYRKAYFFNIAIERL